MIHIQKRNRPIGLRALLLGESVWNYPKQFDGNKNTGTLYHGKGSATSWSRLFIYDLTKEVNTIKIYSGTSRGTVRLPKQLSVFSINGIKTKIINENLKTRENDDKMTLWGTQDVVSGVAENIFVKP